MLRRHVQGVEAMPFVFDFGPLHDCEAHAREDFLHAIAHHSQGMTMTQQRYAAGKRDVDGAGRGRVLRRFLVRFPASLDGDLERVGALPDGLLLIGRRAPDQLHPRRDDALLASEIAIAERLGVVERGRSRELTLE